ncbi:MAG: hypothetical protein RR290_02895 [Clostridia bacterium]
MRYYIYLDKEFLKSLFASISETNFDIEIMEFSIQKGETVTKDINVTPSLDKNCGNSNSKINDEKTDNRSECRKQKSSGMNFFAGETNTSNMIVERRYINVEDVSGIKNLAFYNKLVKRLEILCDGKCNLCIESGKICPCKLKNIYEGVSDRDYPENNKFFYINNKYIWLDNNNLVTDLLFLSSITSEVKVLGFTINKINNIEIVKAVAIYI